MSKPPAADDRLDLVSARIREAAEGMGMRQIDLAAALGYMDGHPDGAGSVNGLWHGHRMPNLSTALALCDACEVDIDWLAGLEDEPGPVDHTLLHKYFPRNVEALLDKKHFGRAGLARRANCSYKYIGNILNGDINDFRLDFAADIAKGLRVSLGDLCTRKRFYNPKVKRF